jgi:hypothetical protein
VHTPLGQSTSSTQVRHRPLDSSHTPCAQSPSPRHWTHVLFVVSQRSPPPQFASLSHSRHTELGSSHTPEAQSPSATQPLHTF